MQDGKYTFTKSYLFNLPIYLKHLDFLNGSKARVAKYLVRHNTEYATKEVDEGPNKGKKYGDLLFQTRLRFLYNRKFCRSIKLGWLAKLSQAITVDESLTQEPWPDLLANIDGKSTKLSRFVRNATGEYLDLGRVGVLAEAPVNIDATAEGAKAKREQSFLKLFPAWAILKAEYHREMDEYQNQLKLVDLYIESTPEGHMYCRRYWLPEMGKDYVVQDFVIETDNIIEKSSGNDLALNVANKGDEKEFTVKLIGDMKAGSLNRIPFAVLGEGPESSVIESTVDKNEEWLNKKSHLDNINRSQSYQRYLGVGVHPEEVKVWNESIFAISKNPDAKVITLQGGDPVALEKDLQDLALEIYLEGFLRHNARYLKQTGSVESAESKREDASTYTDALEDSATKIEELINEALSFIWEFETSATPDGKQGTIEIQKDFHAAISAEENDLMAMLYNMGADWGEAGREAQAKIFISMLNQIPIGGDEDQTEEEYKADLEKRILESAGQERGPARIGNQVEVTDNPASAINQAANE